MVSATDNRIIIVAAGTGNRFGGDVPKQFALLAGRPVLMRTVDAFRSHMPDAGICVVLSQSAIPYWETLCAQYGFESPEIVCGGSSRTASVHNALMSLRHCDDNTLVFIHDSARPIVTAEMLRREIEAFDSTGVEAVVPCTSLTDSLMTNVTDDAVAIDRSTLVAVQTPQVFRAKTILKAYASMPADDVLTDDASVVVKYAGARIHLVEGEQKNIKITYPLDLKIAELYLADF